MPLALTVLASIIVNIVAFHVVLAPSAVGIALTVFALEVTLAWAYRDAFRGVLNPNARPRAATEKVAPVGAIPAHQA